MFYIFIIAIISSLIFGKIALPILKRRKIKQFEREEGPESHLGKLGTPTMGGIFVILAIAFTYLLAWIFQIPVFLENIDSISILMFLSLAFGLIGFIDDFFKVEKKSVDGISPKQKMVLLTLISILFIILELFTFNNPTLITIPFINTTVSMNILIYVILSILVIISTPNAVNLTDGVDGLASSVGASILFYFFIISIIDQRYDVAIFSSIIMGAFLGFLKYNWHKAKVFMGDTGSFFLGGTIALIAIALGRPLDLLFVAIIPVIETLSVILQIFYFKKTGGKRLFKMTPYHHHLELSGWKEETVVLVFTAITLLIGAILILFKIY